MVHTTISITPETHSLIQTLKKSSDINISKEFENYIKTKANKEYINILIHQKQTEIEQLKQTQKTITKQPETPKKTTEFTQDESDFITENFDPKSRKDPALMRLSFDTFKKLFKKEITLEEIDVKFTWQ